MFRLYYKRRFYFLYLKQYDSSNVKNEDENNTHSKPVDTIATATAVPITRSISRKPQVYSCSQCERIFYNQKALCRHENAHKREDTQDKEGGDLVTEKPTGGEAKSTRKNPPKKRRLSANERIACPLCGIETLKHHMSRHMLLHTDIKPFECTTCGRRFHRKDKLQDHQKRSACDKEEKPQAKQKNPAMPKQHTCRKCGYQTYDVKDFRIHRKSHPPPNKYR